MKLIKLIIGLLFLTIAVSCEKLFPGSDNPYYIYNLHLGIEDASGNNLLEGLWNIWQSDYNDEEYQAAMEKNRELYSLEIVFPDEYMDPIHHSAFGRGKQYPSNDRYELGCTIDTNFDWSYSITFNPNRSNMRCEGKDYLPAADKIVYKLSCPSIFGDEEVHEIVTWWKKENHHRRRLCYRIEFEGKEFTQITYERSNTIAYATVVLDR